MVPAQTVDQRVGVPLGASRNIVVTSGSEFGSTPTSIPSGTVAGPSGPVLVWVPQPGSATA